MRRPNARRRVASESNPIDPVEPHHDNQSKNIAKSNSAFFVTILVVITLVFFFFFAFFPGKNWPKYGIIIDGGSTGTRIHVFRYRLEGGRNAVLDFGKDGLMSMRGVPGLSSFAEDPDGADRSLMELLEFAKCQIPKENWEETEIRLMATAGLRMLEVEMQERILEACRRVLRSSGFKFMDEWASVITGIDEGIYAWVTANYALGTLGGDPLHTTGIIELGGASAQVTFVSSESMPFGFSRAVRFGNTTYNLYSHSFLHYGLDVALMSLREALISADFNMATQPLQTGLPLDPCTPKGYSHSVASWKLFPGPLSEQIQSNLSLQTNGNFSECRSAALVLLQKGKEKCSYQHCEIGSTFVPKLQGKFFATENFFYTSKFFGLGPRAFLSELVTAGEEFCGEDWSKLKERYQSLEEEDLLRYCFSSAYIIALLHDSLGIALDDERVTIANQVGSIPLDWALGAFILQTTEDLVVQNHEWITTITSDKWPSLLSLIAIFTVLMFAAWFVTRCRKPQLKTI